MNDFEEAVLNTIIRCEISTYTCCYAPEKAVVPISNISTLLKCSRYKVRKALKSLLNAGYIEYTSQGRPSVESNTENGYELICEALPPVNGYALTKLGFSTKLYSRAVQRSS